MPTLRRFAGPQKDCRLRFMRLLLSGLGYLTAGLTASLPVISRYYFAWDASSLGLGKVLPERIDPVGRWRGWLAAYRTGDFVNGIVTYGAMAMGAPLGVVFFTGAACRR